MIAVLGRELQLRSDLPELHLASTCRAQTPPSPRLLLSAGSHEALNRWLASHQVSVLEPSKPATELSSRSLTDEGGSLGKVET